MIHDPGLASSWHPLLFLRRASSNWVLRPAEPKNPHAHAPEAGPCRPETCFSQAMKIVHFGPISIGLDFWPNLQRKGSTSRDLLRSIATYDVKEAVLASKSSV